MMDFLLTPREFVMSGKLLGSSGCPKISPEELIDLAIESHIARVAKRSLVGGDESFFIADLGQVTRQHQLWVQNLPDVQPYYAVKCNSDPALLKCLANLGTGFDCASVTEICTVLNLGVDPALILFANPCKSPTAMVFARQVGVMRTTFDNLDELDSIKTHMPEAQLLLRIYASDESALISLGDKFGAHLDATQQLLSRAWELGLDVVGVSFHVGTGATNPDSFYKAIKDAHHVFCYAERLGFHPTILDIGGGFQDSHFESMAPVIRETIRSEFPAGVTTIAEPGRFYARRAYTLVSRVIARRRQIGRAAVTGIPDMLYQNDGVYGNFMNVIMEREVMVPHLFGSRKENAKLLTKTTQKAENGPTQNTQQRVAEHRYSIWGPTCDSIDCVIREVTFKSEVKAGDWLKYNNMGAYTSTTATQFNGFDSSHDVFYVNSETSSVY